MDKCLSCEKKLSPVLGSLVSNNPWVTILKPLTSAWTFVKGQLMGRC